MTDRFESILDESISALQAGVSLDEILAEVPEYAAELRPLLYAATLLADPNPRLVPAERKAALRAEYIAQVAELPSVHPSFGQKLRAVQSVIQRRLTPKMVLNDLLTVIITVILTLAMAALVLSYAATDTIPGDLLYSVKQITENTQLLLTTSDAQKQELSDTFNQRRLAEIEQLVNQKRAAAVSFTGLLQTKSSALWVVEGHTVFLPDDVVIEGKPEEGDQVKVFGLLRSNNVLVADTISQVE